MTLNLTTQVGDSELIKRAKALRERFRTSAAQIDLKGEYPHENFQHIWEAELYRLMVPQAYGGLNNAKVNAHIEAIWKSLPTSLPERAVQGWFLRSMHPLCAGSLMRRMVYEKQHVNNWHEKRFRKTLALLRLIPVAR